MDPLVPLFIAITVGVFLLIASALGWREMRHLRRKLDAQDVRIKAAALAAAAEAVREYEADRQKGVRGEG